jgi:hypothetical protein
MKVDENPIYINIRQNKKKNLKTKTKRPNGKKKKITSKVDY